MSKGQRKKIMEIENIEINNNNNHQINHQIFRDSNKRILEES